MKAYIQTDKNGEFYNVNAFIANEGFKNFGFEIEKFVNADEISDKNPENIIVGGIGNVRKRLQNLNIIRENKEIDYPEELKSFLKRKIWTLQLMKYLIKKNGIFLLSPKQKQNYSQEKSLKAKWTF